MGKLITLPVLSVADLMKVGPEGYIHGYICVRPPCGEKPGKIQPYDLKIQRDGGIVHRPSGYSVGHLAKNDDGTYTATHADGAKDKPTKVQFDSLRAVSKRYNSGETDKSLGGSPRKPAARKPPAAVKPHADKPKSPNSPVPSGKERSGNQVWKTDEGTADLTPAEKKAIANTWYSKSFLNTNDYLRNDHISMGSYYGLNTRADVDKFKSDVGTFEKAVDKAKPFESDVSLLRGINHPEEIFGKPGSMTGKTFTDKGFTSATSNMGVEKSYSTGYGGSTALMTIHARKGSKALKVDPAVWAASHPRKGQTPPDVLQEYTFPPGVPYKILSDTLGSDGVRRMDVEVTP